LIKFRTINNHFPNETGNWSGTPRDERLCHLCNCNKIGDEYHYSMECMAFTELREKVLPYRYYFVRPNTLKFGNLMSTINYRHQKDLAYLFQKVFDFINSSED
jgi:hypothetical protein